VVQRAVISPQGRTAAALTFLRRHSQITALAIGLLLALAGSLGWRYKKVDPIWGSVLVGIGSSIVAAAIVAYLSPFSETAYRRFISLGIDEVWPSRGDVPKRNWVDWLGAAENGCVLLGIAHGEWCKDPRFPTTLRDRLERGVRVKMLFLHPSSASADTRTHEEQNRRNTADAIRESIEFIWEFRGSLPAGIRDRLRVYVYAATPSCGLTWIDDFMIATHYLAGLWNRTSPALRVKPPFIGMGQSLYNVYAENLQNIEAGSTEVDDRNVRDFLPHQAHPESQE